MADPLSLATRGRFTSSSYENSYLITLATLGRIVSASSEEIGGYAGSGYPIIFYSPQHKNLVEEKQIVKEEEIEGIEVTSKEPKHLVQRPPLAENIQSISEIIEDRELVLELIRSAILDHQQKELELLKLKETLYKKYKRNRNILLAIMLDEM